MLKDAIEAINLSIKLLDETIQNLENKKVLEFNLWKTTLELDYAALVLSLTNNLIDFNPNLNDFSIESVKETLIKAQSLLKEVLNIMNNDPTLAYAKIKQTIKLVKKVKEITS